MCHLVTHYLNGPQANIFILFSVLLFACIFLDECSGIRYLPKVLQNSVNWPRNGVRKLNRHQQEETRPVHSLRGRDPAHHFHHHRHRRVRGERQHSG